MKRYLLFTRDNWDLLGGWDDFRNSFDSLDEAKAAGESTVRGPENDYDGFDCHHIVDTATMKIVKRHPKVSKVSKPVDPNTVLLTLAPIEQIYQWRRNAEGQLKALEDEIERRKACSQKKIGESAKENLRGGTQRTD